MLCQTAIVHGRKIGETTYEFGHEGILYRHSFIMYDKATESLWVHTTGEAVKGTCKGQVLPFLPSTVTSWGTWKKLHPKTTVLTGKRANSFMGKFGFEQRPQRYGFSLGQGTKPKLYPFPLLMKKGVVNDEFEGRKVVVFFDADTNTARAFERGKHTFAFHKAKVTDEKGRPWDMLRGLLEQAAEGEGAERLTPLPGTTWLIERWQGFHPRAPVYKLP